MSDPTWDDVGIDEEEVTEEEAREIESGGRVPAGLYLCQGWNSNPKIMTYKNASLGVELTHKIIEVLEVNKRLPTDEEKQMIVGKTLSDEIPFAYDNEADWSVKRRKNAALKIGIVKPGYAITKNMWAKDFVEKTYIVRVVENNYRKKNKQTGEEYGDVIESTKIGFFDGYESAGDRNNVVESESEFVDEDI